MPNNNTTKGGWWKQLLRFLKIHNSLTIVIAAALLLELTTGVMYYAAQSIIQRTMEELVEREMNAIYLSIRNRLAQVEVTLDDMAWVVSDNLEETEWVYEITRRCVEHNPEVMGCGVAFVPNYYPQEGHWFEPYSRRKADGTIESLQLGSAEHDYLNSAFFTEPIDEGSGHWCEPYLDKDGAKAMVTTYAVPICDADNKVAGIVGVDVSLHWLDGVVEENRVYQSTRRFLVTGRDNLLVGVDGPIYKKVLEQLKADDDKKGYVTMKDEDGKTLHVFFTPVGGKTDWVIINVLYDDEVFGTLRHVRHLLLLLVMAGLVLIGFIVWRTSRNLERLRKVKAEKDRIRAELRVASEIQQSMLPQNYLLHDEVEICGSLVPAREVGGDLFDYFIRDGKLFFCIGDVSGKGAPAALLMAVTHALFRSSSTHENNPALIMRSINEAICQGNESNMFVTMFIGVLDLSSGCLCYCNAGHDAPFITKDEEKSMLPADANLPVGVFDDTPYSEQMAQLRPESTIFLYTDGLTEAMNSQHKQFGMERTEETMSQCAKALLRPKDILAKVTEAVHDFVKDAEQSDDLTIFAIRYTPK